MSRACTALLALLAPVAFGCDFQELVINNYGCALSKIDVHNYPKPPPQPSCPPPQNATAAMASAEAEARARAVSFEEVYGKVLRRRCRRCHLLGTPEAHLVMSDIGRAYTNLVDDKGEGDINCTSMQACGDGNSVRVTSRVTKYQPACSLLYLAVAHDPQSGSCAESMPFHGMPLNAYEVALVRSWIQSGAPPPVMERSSSSSK